MASKLIAGCFLCAFWLGVLHPRLAVSGDKPSQEYEPEAQPGGASDLSRFQDARMYFGRRENDWKAPPQNMRKYHDLVGLPGDYRSPITIGGEKLRFSPESIKNLVSHGDGSVHWEVWRLELQREGISWMAEFLKRWPLPEPFERGFHYNRPWTIDPVQNTPLGWDGSFQGMEELRVGENPYVGYEGLGGRPLVHWRLYRYGARYITPRLKLSDLKKYAPWFYDHIPSYVLEREDWFHFWHMDSMAVYINNRGSDTSTPRMIEFCGRFSFDGKAQEKRFDTFFDPKVFRRIHIRNGGLEQSAMNLARPCRESDVMILHAPSDSFRIRFMVPAPKLKQPAGQNLSPLRPATAPASVRPPAEKIAGPKVDPVLGGRTLNKEVIQKHLKARHKMFIRTVPPPLVLASLQADHVYRVTDYIVNGNGNDDVVSLQSPTTDQRPQAILDFIHRATLLWWVEE